MSTQGKARVLITAGATSNVEAYVRALEVSGAEPVVGRPAPSGSPDLSLQGFDAVVLAGGPDVAPARFGATVPRSLEALVQVDEPRDELEWRVLDEVERRGLPVLAICRGVQALNVHRGGTLRLDLPGEGFTAIHHQQRDRRHQPVHEVTVAEGRLRSILGASRLRVNSIHHQSVREVAPDLRVAARAGDGVIEGLESADGRLLGVQWHPELLFDTEEPARRLFADLLARVGTPTPVA